MRNVRLIIAGSVEVDVSGAVVVEVPDDTSEAELSNLIGVNGDGFAVKLADNAGWWYQDDDSDWDGRTANIVEVEEVSEIDPETPTVSLIRDQDGELQMNGGEE